MNAKVKINNSKTCFLVALNICSLSVVLCFRIDGIISQSLNMKFEYKKPRVIKKKEKGGLNVMA
jgi:hypothetical protein